jgi:hypothetical protein
MLQPFAAIFRLDTAVHHFNFLLSLCPNHSTCLKPLFLPLQMIFRDERQRGERLSYWSLEARSASSSTLLPLAIPSTDSDPHLDLLHRLGAWQLPRPFPFDHLLPFPPLQLLLPRSAWSRRHLRLG